MTTKLSRKERALIDYVESDDATSIDNLETDKKRYTQIARAQMGKKKTISIRLLESDIERIKAKSVSYFFTVNLAERRKTSQTDLLLGLVNSPQLTH
jgi:predicted DNA binding CopG/RHH family protein